MDSTAIRMLIAREIVPRMTPDSTTLTVLAAVKEHLSAAGLPTDPETELEAIVSRWFSEYVYAAALASLDPDEFGA